VVGLSAGAQGAVSRARGWRGRGRVGVGAFAARGLAHALEPFRHAFEVATHACGCGALAGAAQWGVEVGVGGAIDRGSGS
jgi:hypothetical protein